MIVERLVAYAWLQDPEDELERVRAAVRSGDDSWERWLRDVRRGDALIASMRLAAHVRMPGGRRRTVEVENHHLWLELDPHPPIVEREIQEISGKDCNALATRMCDLGIDVTGDELCEMYVHVDLSEGLLARIRGCRRRAGMSAPAARLGRGTETGSDVITEVR